MRDDLMREVTELARRLRDLADAPGTTGRERADLRRAADLLEAIGQQEPVAWRTEDYRTDKSATTYDSAVAERWQTKGWPIQSLYLHPQPAQPQERSCTCPPDDNPPVPCAQRYALDECRLAAIDSRVAVTKSNS